MKHIIAISLIAVYAAIWYGIIFIPLSPLRSLGCIIASFPILHVLSVLYDKDEQPMKKTYQFGMLKKKVYVVAESILEAKRKIKEMGYNNLKFERIKVIDTYEQ